MTGIDPVFTLGNLEAERVRLLEALSAEGLLAANGLLPLNPMPLRVALVSLLVACRTVSCRFCAACSHSSLQVWSGAVPQSC